MEIDTSKSRRERYPCYKLVSSTVPAGGDFCNAAEESCVEGIDVMAGREKAETVMAGGEGEAATVMARIFMERYTMAGAAMEERRRLGRRLARKSAVKHARFFVHFLAAEHQTFTTVEERRESAEKKEMK